MKNIITLNNSIKMPQVGFGVFKIEDEKTDIPVKEAIEIGYRNIDTAQAYGNEEGTGRGIKLGLESTGLSREDLFVTSKIWNDHITYEETIKGFESSLEKLGLDYIDLYLIHWPGDNSFKESYKALEYLYTEGKIKAIGVCNFNINHLEELLFFAKVIPVVNQIEIHPKLTQKDIINFCSKKGIRVQAWSPLMQGQIFDNKLLIEMAKKYNKTVAQVILRWNIQNDLLFVVKSVTKSRIESNFDIFDFELSKEDIEKIDGLNENLRVGPNPEFFDFK